MLVHTMASPSVHASAGQEMGELSHDECDENQANGADAPCQKERAHNRRLRQSGLLGPNQDACVAHC